MRPLLFTILGLLVGITLIGGGGYYLLRERGDKDYVKLGLRG